MNTNRKLLLFCLCFSFFFKTNGQTRPLPNNIDSICSHIDSLSINRSVFEEFDFQVNMPGVSVGSRVHYIDTLNKQFKKIVFKNDPDTLTKIFYFHKEKLIEISIERNVTVKQGAKYQFKEDSVLNEWDPDRLINNVGRIVSEAKRYYMLVHY